MVKRDARKLDHKTPGFSRACIYNWLARYRAGGWDGLKPKPLAGRPTKVTGGQMRGLYCTVAGKNPLQFRFEFALWTRWMIQTRSGPRRTAAGADKN
jgi:transposase